MTANAQWLLELAHSIENKLVKSQLFSANRVNARIINEKTVDETQT